MLSRETLDDASVIAECKKKSSPPDQIKSRRNDVKVLQHLSRLRQAILALPTKELQVTQASELDGLMTMPQLIKSLEELKKATEMHLHEQFGIVIDGDSFKKKYKVSAENLSLELENQFESFIDRNIANKKNISTEEVRKITEDKIKQFCTQNPVPDELRKLMQNYIFLVCASKVFRKTDSLQLLDIFKIIISPQKAKEVFQLSREKILQPYIGLIYCAEQVSVLPGSEPQWQEIALWIKALYLRVYKQVPAKFKDAQGNVLKDKDGYYPAIDTSDKYFRDYKEKTTKLEMSDINREICYRLEEKLGMTSEKNIIAEVKFYTQGNSNSQAVLAKAHANSSPTMASPPIALATEVVASQPALSVIGEDLGVRYNLTLKKSECDEAKKNQIRNFVREILYSNKLKVSDEFMGRYLSRYISCDLQTQLSQLALCLKRYALTKDQILLLHRITKDMDLFFKKYIAESFSIYYLYGLIARTHQDIATKTWAAMTLEQKLQTLLSLEQELRSEKTSKHMLPKIQSVLNRVFKGLALLNKGSASEEGEENKRLPLEDDAEFDSMNSQDLETQLQIDETPECYQFTLSVPTELRTKDRMDQLNDFFQESISDLVKVKDNYLENYMFYLRNESLEVKFDHLWFCLHKYKLTGRQMQLLQRNIDEADLFFKNYKTTSCSIFNAWGIFRHTNVSDTWLTKTSCQDKLIYLLNTWQDLSNEEGSNNVLPNIERILTQVFDNLGGVPQPDLVTHCRA